MKTSLLPLRSGVASLLAFLLAPCAGAIPFNDQIGFAADLGSVTEVLRQSDPLIASFEEFEQTLEASDPMILLEERTGSLWFKWTAPSNGNYHLSGIQGGDLVDIYKSESGQPGEVIPISEDLYTVSFTAAAGDQFFFRHTAPAFSWDFFSPPPPPGGFILRKEGTSRVSDFGARSGLVAYLTSYGEANSEKYRWTVGRSGDYRLYLETWVDPEEVVIPPLVVRRNGTIVSGVAYGEQSTLTLVAGDLIEVTVGGHLGFIPLSFVPNVSAADLGNVSSADVPSRAEDDSAWEWTVPQDGFVKIGLSTPFWDNELLLMNFETFKTESCAVGPLDSDKHTLAFEVSLVKKVTAGEIYGFADTLQFDSGDLSRAISLRFFSTPSTLEERILAASALLALKTDEALEAADAHLVAALALDPASPQANALRAVTRLALLERDPAYASFLESLNVTNVEGGVFSSTYSIPRAEDGSPIFPENATATGRIAALRQLFTPRLAEIRGLLTAATGDGSNPSYVARFGRSYVLDEADLLAMTASVDIVQALFDLLAIHDLGGSLNALVELEKEGVLDLEQALAEIPSLLEVADSAAIATFKSRIRQANTLLCAALIKSSAEREVSGNHPFPPISNPTDGSDFLEHLESLGRIDEAFHGPVVISGWTIDFSQWNATSPSWRSFFPELRGNKVVAMTAPDPSLGGILPGATQSTFDGLLDSHGVLANPAGFSFWIQNFFELGVPPYLAGFMQDADGDGQTNGDEYYFASDPGDPSIMIQTPVSALAQTSGGQRYRVSFVRRIDHEEIRYLASVSEDMVTWNYTGPEVTIIGSPVPVGDGEGEIVTVEIAGALANRKFVRIHAVTR